MDILVVIADSAGDDWAGVDFCILVAGSILENSSLLLALQMKNMNRNTPLPLGTIWSRNRMEWPG